MSYVAKNMSPADENGIRLLSSFEAGDHSSKKQIFEGFPKICLKETFQSLVL
jgi:hypothetical protein